MGKGQPGHLLTLPFEDAFAGSVREVVRVFVFRIEKWMF
jgi:hypothetical protein